MQEYFSDGITEDIITQLSKIADLKVISRTSVMEYKGVKRNVKEIANELGVRAILEGSVRKEGDKVRITAQLIDAKTDKHLWGRNF
jgi:adenylate cyclase